MSRFVGLVFLGLCCAVLGCGGGPSYVAVSGKVFYNGEPLKGVQVMFQPQAAKGIDAGGVGSFARTDDNGQYTLEAATPYPTKGALVGKHTVRIAFPTAGTEASEDSDAASPAGKKGAPRPGVQAIPAKYNIDSILTFEVPPGGTSSADFKLEGPPLPKGK
jgi:hypothetical protein